MAMGTSSERQGGGNATDLGVRPFRDLDAVNVAGLVQRCLREVNSHDYAADIIDGMCRHFTPDRFIELSQSRSVYVAEIADQLVGTVSRDGNKVYTMFVDPDQHGRGIGRYLMLHIETHAADEGYDFMETGASITGHRFYHRLGYVDVRETETELSGLNYIMRKTLH
ncbi:GNAT family N-acetyltransferase [Spirillospora sp. NPDC029432]|uniref:GNAT family N-acetyltransferase n=1 Tax=Spirillospora sp. NPDC029432 TaxID=3154599 RepID=UPI0034512116